MQSQSDSTQNMHTGHIVRQDYEVRVTDDEEYVVLSAFEGREPPLAETKKPDYSTALRMAGGVSG
jgi:hypothetical protein